MGRGWRQLRCAESRRGPLLKVDGFDGDAVAFGTVESLKTVDGKWIMDGTFLSGTSLERVRVWKNLEVGWNLGKGHQVLVHNWWEGDQGTLGLSRLGTIGGIAWTWGSLKKGNLKVLILYCLNSVFLFRPVS